MGPTSVETSTANKKLRLRDKKQQIFVISTTFWGGKTSVSNAAYGINNIPTRSIANKTTKNN
jgi:hypothetical protein